MEITIPENYKKYPTDCICRINDASGWGGAYVYVCGKCRYACCDEAKTMQCVCLYCYSCEKHKKDRVCVGSHS